MTQTKTIPLTPGAIDLAGKVIERRQFLVGPRAIEVSLEVFALVRLGIAKVDAHHLILRHGGRRMLEKALRAQQQIQAAQ